MNRITLGILAHVDAGKTTLTEALLYIAGSIRKLGRVDNGDAFLDTDSLEKQRGITIFSKQACFMYGDTEITLLDTPGHVDFSAETERTLQVLDAAILVVSGTSGVQSHTETLFKLLMKHHVPTFIFVNKTDMPWLGSAFVMRDIRRKLSPNAHEASRLDNFEDVSMCSEALMEKYLEEGTLSSADIRGAVSSACLFPVFYGSALKTDGVKAFLDGLLSLFSEPKRHDTFGARVFKITRDEKGVRLAHMKITGGRLRVKDTVTVGENEYKIDGIRQYSGAKFRPLDEAPAGTVCAVTGADGLITGSVLGCEEETKAPVLEPVLSYRLILPDTLDAHTAFASLRLLEEEDPCLRLSYNESSGEIHALIMGRVQVEVLQSVIKARFGWDVTFGAGQIMYRETIRDTVEGVGHYEPLRHYSEVHLLLEPGEEGSGVVIRSDCSTDDLAKNWQRLILTHLEEKVHKGVLTGAPVTDIIITLMSGRASKKHTEGGDFREATYRAVRQGLMKAESVLLEPWYTFDITVPSECVGRLMSDIQRMGGIFAAPETDENDARLHGEAPVGEITNYGEELAAYTHGHFGISLADAVYHPCHDAERVIAEKAYDADTDVYNTADSVFCEGGAGFLVKWYEVENYMHLESVLNYNPDKAEEHRELMRRAERFTSAAATDKELMAIFERTYGKIKPRMTNRTGKHFKAASAASHSYVQKKKPVEESGETYLLVDGYNIIFAVDELRKASEHGLDTAREQLIHRLCNYQGFWGEHVILVFDAYKVKKHPGEIETFRNIHVVYTKSAETADTYIERVSGQLIKAHHRVKVATSDGSEQMIILGNGALRVPAAAFYKELTDAEKAIRDALDGQF